MYNNYIYVYLGIVTDPIVPCGQFLSTNKTDVDLSDYTIQPTQSILRYGLENITCSATLVFEGSEALDLTELNDMGFIEFFYQIYFDGSNKTKAIRIKEDSIVHYTYTLNNLSYEDSGEYSVVATFCTNEFAIQFQATQILELLS